MRNADIDMRFQQEIMTPEEVARFLRKSPSWVYKHWRELGGRKLGGSLFFPGKESLYERLFSEGERVEARLHSQREKVHLPVLQNQERSPKGRNPKKGGNPEPSTTEGGGDDPNRHGLFRPDKQET